MLAHATSSSALRPPEPSQRACERRLENGEPREVRRDQAVEKLRDSRRERQFDGPAIVRTREFDHEVGLSIRDTSSAAVCGRSEVGR